MKALRALVLIFVLAGLAVVSAQSVSPASHPQPASSAADAASPSKDLAVDSHSPQLDQSKLSLQGGTIESVNQVTNELLLKTFGGGHTKVLFDERTHIYLDQLTPGRQRDLRRGQRVHVDTSLDGTRVFARNIYLLGELPAVESRGQVESYQASTAELIMRDSALGTSIRVHLLPSTVVTYNAQPISPINIKPGSLIVVGFQSAATGRVNASVISVVAQVGDAFTFAGHVAHLDMRSQLVVLETGFDHRTYEIYFSAPMTDAVGLREGREVTITAVFDGTHYNGTNLILAP